MKRNKIGTNNRQSRLNPHTVTRRDFVASLACAGTASMIPFGSAAQRPLAAADRLAADPMRPQFHLLPAGNWMNDPNGPIYFNGSYHMFFQLNPHGALWGDMNWAHAVSPDMIHWRHLPIALSPTPGGPDAAGCFTGSAIIVGKRVYFVYTGVVDSLPAKATLRDGKHNFLESQCLAWSDDPDLIHWTKLPNPIVAEPPEGLAVTGFRDPSVWKQHGSYYMTVGTGMPKIGGGVLLYRSNDLRRWTYLHLLASGRWSSKASTDPVTSGEMWECPELFELDGRHVLIYSTERKVFWETGRLNHETMLFHVEKRGRLDYGKYYAPKTQLDRAGNRILWGWIPETRADAELVAAGWAGMMSLPRVLNVETDGTLRMQFLPELITLRDSSLPSGVLRTSEITATLTGAAGEVLITGSAECGPFELTVNTSFDEKLMLQLSYFPEKHVIMIDGEEELSLSWAEGVHMHAYFDGSVVELMVNSRHCYTKRFYYDKGRAPDIILHLLGGKPKDLKLAVWKITSISKDRFTTRSRNS
jgi:beta-fructofuranosidase